MKASIYARVATLVLLFATILVSFKISAAPKKLRVDNRDEAARLIANGGRVLADYGAFQLIEVDNSAKGLAFAQSAEDADESNFIELNTGKLDTRIPEVAALRKNVVGFAGKKLHLVQFVGPSKPEWLEALEQTGVKVVHYIPQNAYLVHGDAAALARLQAWARTADFVQWEATYSEDYKIHPKARTHDKAGNVVKPATDVFTVQLLEDADANPATLALIDQLKLSPIQQQFNTLHYLNVVVELPAEQLSEIAARPDVISIQPRLPRHKMDERQDQIMAGNLTGSLPTGPGYLAWLASKGFTQSQFLTSGFVVDVTDSGIDNGTTSPGHFGLYRSGDPNLPSRVAYTRLEGTANVGSSIQGCDGHGNLNSHIIAGFNDRASGFPHTDASGFHYGLGVCPFVKVGSSVIFDFDFTNPSYPNLASRAYRDAARVSNNSWGADTAGDYDSDAQAYDALVRDAQPSGSAVPNSGNQEMVFVFAAGNAGSAAMTVGSPGTAKNVIVVGAVENVHSHSTANGGNSSVGNDGCSSPDTQANSANDIATFSSRGPCADGRQKPDLVAPGTHITGGVGQSSTSTNGTGAALSCFNATGVCALPGGGTVGSVNNFFPLSQQFYTTSSGTSHSTPGVAGACALLRQYFINTGLNAPSPAMTKAFLVNSARYLTGTSANDTLPSPNQGMGEVNLGFAFDGTARVLLDQVSTNKFTASGQTRTVTGMITDTGKPFRVTLAWTDAPGSTTGNAYNNNLDLTVTVGGNTYKGNVFSGGTSVTGGSSDTKNNLESVFLPAGVSGNFVVTVTAANINSDGVPNEAPSLDQDFALVVYNGSEAGVPPIIQSQPQSQTVGQGSAAGFAVGVVGEAPLRYQWYSNLVAITDATNASYNIASAQLSDQGNYFAIVTNVNGSATSSVASLTVVTSPLILTNPASLTLLRGSTANFSVTAIGAAPLAYQWRFNGGDISGATNSAYSKSNVQLTDSGAYAVVVTNVSGSVTSAPANLNVFTNASGGLAISQIYGGGGNGGATYRNDYVELYNRNGSPVSLAGWSIQYASSSGTSWAVVNLSGAVPAGGYYLVQLASGGATGSILPAADVTNTTVNISASNGKVALVTNQVALSGSSPIGNSALADFVGYGTANAFEGSAAATGGGNSVAIFRKDGGATDTDDNAADFLTGAPNPRSSISGPPKIDLAISKTHSGNFTRGDAADVYTITVNNIGSLATTNTVTVTDVLPSGLTAVALSGTGWTTDLGTLTCTRSDVLNGGATFPAITLTVSVATNALSSVTNVASVSTGGDTNLANNSVSDVTAIVSSGGGGGSTNVILGWDVSGLSTYGPSPITPTVSAANATTTGLTRGSGVGTSGSAAARAWGGNGFDTTSAAAAITANDFATFGLTANVGYKASFTAISRFDYRRSGMGATEGVLQYQVNGGSFVTIATNSYSSSSSSGASLPAINLSTITDLQNVGAGTNVTFRIVNYNAGNSGGTWYIYDVANSPALDFAVTGSVDPIGGTPASAPLLTVPSLVGGQFQFTLTGTAGSNYVVEVSTNLSSNSWIPVRTSTPPILFSEPATNVQRFYRGVVTH